MHLIPVLWRKRHKAYPDALLADFRKHFREEWLPHRAIEYFRGRDSEALQFLPKLIAANKAKRRLN